ncbi:acetyltransferase (GNAT) family protein [Sinobacterium caligoides]|uniref:Acetyltransferase (GNAT) family protein n=1 Tax=Sinobacterium caligoides TaxID=933926 RepID=A0A3N2DQY1_9GAMM|nr:GNAT family N-acetyltransferase [Sinobacterium caligoides]ROS02072.1 acetyltransferase (GNAT) family protein [Sinobacterium caligoides]
MSQYRISCDKEAMDWHYIHQVIADSYWAKGISQTTMFKALDNSLCFAIFDAAGQQVGFARLITDRATFAYLADVFVDEQHQKKGLSKLLLKAIMGHPDLQGLRRIMLATRDAHGLYQQFGFEPIENPEMLMQVWQPNVYRQLAE